MSDNTGHEGIGVGWFIPYTFGPHVGPLEVSTAETRKQELEDLKQQLAQVTEERDELKYRLQTWNDAAADHQREQAKKETP